MRGVKICEYLQRSRPRHQITWLVSITPQSFYSREESPWYAFVKRLGGPQSRFGRSGEEDYFYFCCESNPGQAGFPLRRPGFKPESGHVGFGDGQKWRCGRFSPRTSVSPANLHSICFSTIIFTIIRGWHNRPGVAAVPIASQTK
jgi:hypothetical protein